MRLRTASFWRARVPLPRRVAGRVFPRGAAFRRLRGFFVAAVGTEHYGRERTHKIMSILTNVRKTDTPQTWRASVRGVASVAIRAPRERVRSGVLEVRPGFSGAGRPRRAVRPTAEPRELRAEPL